MFDTASPTDTSSEAEGLGMLTSDAELLAGVMAAQQECSRAEVALARALAELQVRGVTDRCFGLKTAAWVAAEAKVDRAGVARRLRLGLRLRPLTVVDAAVRSGSISVDHASALAEAAANPRVGEQIEAVQSVWVDLAATTSFADWKHQLIHTVVELDQDGGYDPNRDLARNRLQFTAFPDGLTTGRFELVGERALVVRQCVEAHADRLFLRLKRDHDLCPELPLPTRATVMAMALAELVLRGSTVDVERTPGLATDVTLVIEATPPPPPPPAAPPSLAAPDASTDSDDRGDGCGRFDPLDPHGMVDRPAIAAFIEQCGTAKSPDGYHVHHEVAECLLCDPIITALIVDSLGVPLDMGRQIRLANRDQRRALAKRDGGCVFPGCDAPVGWCDAHHVTHWEHGGPTDVANLALLCRYHHGVSHRTGWTMTAHTDQTFTWRTPLGQMLHSQRHRGRSPTPPPTRQAVYA